MTAAAPAHRNPKPDPAQAAAAEVKKQQIIRAPWPIRAAFRGLGRVAPGAMGRLATRLWFTPPRPRRPEAERALLAEAEEAFELVLDGKRIRGHAWGQGPTVLLVHGWGGRGAQWRAFVPPLLARGFRVVIFDGPAHGDSDGRTTDVPEFARVIEALALREDGLHAMLAHSFGAVCAAFAAKRYVAVDKLAMISPPSRLDDMTAIFQRALDMPASVVASMRRGIERRVADLGPRVWREGSTHWNAGGFDFPGLIVHDRADRVVPFDQGLMIHEAWPNAELAAVDGLGHYRILKDPDVIERVIAFLA